LNDHGSECVIDLKPCVNNWDEAHNIQCNNSSYKCVGDRFFGKYAYYELYTTGEHTQLYMNLKTNIFTKLFGRIWNFYAKDFSKFYSIHKQLNAKGYTTCDLS